MDKSNAASSDFGIALRRQWRLMMYISGPVVAAFVGIALGWPSAFQATSVIRIDQQYEKDDRAIDTYAEYYVATLAQEVLKSDNRKAWVQEFDLFPDKLDWTLADKMDEVKKQIRTPIITTVVIDPASGREREVVTGFEVSYRSKSPIEAQQVSVRAAESFIAEDRRAKLTASEREIGLYVREADQYRSKIAEVEARLADFKKLNSRRLPELAQLNWSAIDRVERDLETTQMQIDNLKRERVILRSEISQIPTAPNEAIAKLAELQNEYVRARSIYQDDHPEVVSLKKQLDTLTRAVDSSAAIPILRQQQQEIAVALADARKRYSEDHPEVRQLIRSQSALQERIVRLAAGQNATGGDVGSTNELYVQLDTQIKAIDSQIAGFNGRVKELRQKGIEYEQLLLETPQVEREYQELSRDLANAQELYEQTQERQRDAELSLALSQDGRQDQLVLAQSASVPAFPAWPPRAAIIVLGVILGSGLGIGVAMLREATNTTVRSSRDAFELCHVPPIALIPTMRNRKRRMMRQFQNAGFLASTVAVVTVAYAAAHFL